MSKQTEYERAAEVTQGMDNHLAAISEQGKNWTAIMLLRVKLNFLRTIESHATIYQEVLRENMEVKRRKGK